MFEAILIRLGQYIAQSLIDKGFQVKAVIDRFESIDQDGQKIIVKVEKAETEQERKDAFDDILRHDDKLK